MCLVFSLYTEEYQVYSLHNILWQQFAVLNYHHVDFDVKFQSISDSHMKDFLHQINITIYQYTLIFTLYQNKAMWLW